MRGNFDFYPPKTVRFQPELSAVISVTLSHPSEVDDLEKCHGTIKYKTMLPPTGDAQRGEG